MLDLFAVLYYTMTVEYNKRMNTSIDREKDWKGYRKVGNKMIPRDDLQALHIEYDNYLLQRLTDPAPYLTFKKYLSSRQLGFLCDFYDSIRFDDGSFVGEPGAEMWQKQYAMKGTIQYTSYLRHMNAPHISGSTCCCDTPSNAD